MGDSSWVEDFSQFKDSHSSMGLQGRKSGGGSKTIQHTQTRAEKIQAELKLLEWHKLANDAALKAALMQTKTLRSEIPQVKPKHVADDAKWIKKVIEQEHMKSLEVSKDYVMKYEAKQKDIQERQSAAIEKHVDTLSKTRKRFEDKVHLKKTTNEYREFQRNFTEKKWAILKGETLEDYENKKRAQSSGGGPATNDENNNNAGDRIPPPSDLTNVLESLNKLAVLEKRISTLEGQNEYEKLNMRNRIPVQERTSLEFKKKRGLGDGNVKKLVYTIKPKKTAYGSSSGGGANAVRNRRAQRGGITTSTEDGGGTFLTGGDFGGSNTGLSNNNTTQGQAMTREERMRARRRELEQATPGQKSMRNRIQAKKAKVREALVSNKRHTDAMSELTRRRREQGAREKGKLQASRINNRNQGATRATKGASAGIRTKNKHLADFQRAKGAHQRRREDMAKRTLDRVNKKGRDNAFRARAAVNKSGMGLQSHSATAPANANSRIRGGRTSVRGGTNTRRSSSGVMPTRRARSQGGAEMPVAGIVGGGVNGLRALRVSRAQNGSNIRGRNNNNANNSGLSLQGIGSRR